MALIEMPVTYHPILTELELMNVTAGNVKESLFNWVVEMDQQEFDQFCAEITGVYRFWKQFRGCRISDDSDILSPYLPILTRAECIVEIDDVHFAKAKFYRWLENTSPGTLRNICAELECLCDMALSNSGAYIIDEVFFRVNGICNWWRLNCGKPKYEGMLRYFTA